MAAILVYNDLVAALPEWQNRGNDAEYLARVPEFIQQGELRLFRRLRCPGNERIATYLDTENDNRHGINIPNDFLEAKWLIYGDTPLSRISDQRYLTLSGQSGGFTPRPPQYFARIDQAYAFYPHADSNKTVRMGYYEFQGPLGETFTWTRMLRIAPFLYLYAALLEGALFIRDPEGIAEWGQRFESELGELNAQAQDNEHSGSTNEVTSAVCSNW